MKNNLAQATPNLALDQAWGHALPANDETPRLREGYVGGHYIRLHHIRGSWRLSLNENMLYDGSAEEAVKLFDRLCIALGAD